MKESKRHLTASKTRFFKKTEFFNAVSYLGYFL